MLPFSGLHTKQSLEAFVKALLLTVLFLSTNVFAEEAQTSTPPSAVVTNLETCFSPKEDCALKLITVINAAEKTLDIAIFSITHLNITEAIKAAKDRGVVIRMVVDKGQSEGVKSRTNELVAAKIPLKIGKASGIMHDKYTIVDGVMMQTGSFNYTTSAAKSNTENQIYITDKDVIKRYQDNFENLWDDGTLKVNPSSLDD